MKKFLLPGFLVIFLSACTMGTPAPTAVSVVETVGTEKTLPPAIEADTPTPTLTATATIPPTPTPPPLYFTDDFDTSLDYWQFLQTGGLSLPVTSIENGSLRVDIPSEDTWSIGVHNAHSYTDVFVRAKFAASPSGSVGLICRYDETLGWFEFNLASNGTYSLLFGQWLAEGIAQYQPILTDPSRTSGLNGEIGLFCEGNFLRLYADGVLLRNLDVTNYGLTGGRVGITASSFADIPMVALFDWVQVSDQ